MSKAKARQKLNLSLKKKGLAMLNEMEKLGSGYFALTTQQEGETEGCLIVINEPTKARQLEQLFLELYTKWEAQDAEEKQAVAVGGIQ